MMARIGQIDLKAKALNDTRDELMRELGDRLGLDHDPAAVNKLVIAIETFIEAKIERDRW